ncbi:MAG: threonine/serine exporter family protein [Herbinix sp.]|nr:threonine/serine exporter family protein [Herbinix sp.]
MIIQVISAFIATAAFSILFYLPKKYILNAGMAGGLGWFIYLLAMNSCKDKAFANLCATFIVALISHILARVYKTPVTMFLIPGIIPLVPGAGMYQIVHSFLYSEIDSAANYFFETLKMAGAIALGIFVVDTFFRAMINKKKN